MSRSMPNEFEFLRAMPFGPYLPVDSPLHRLDPRTRILLILMYMVTLIVAQNPLGLLFGLAVVLTVWRIGRLPFGPLLRGWRSAAPFLLILALIQVVLGSLGQGEQALFRLGPLAVSAGDLIAGLSLLLRFMGLMAVLGMASSSISESELTRGLEALLRPLAVLRVPIYDFVTIIQVTMRYVPLLAQTAERIAKAQASRGADWAPTGWNIIHRAQQIIPLIVPLFITSLRRAESMALAMDARGYGSSPTRTSMIQLKFTGADALALVIAVILAAAVLLIR